MVDQAWCGGGTRSPAGLDRLRALGAEPVILDGLDGAAVGQAVARAEPEVVIHQMTALAGASLGDLRHFDAGSPAPTSCAAPDRPSAGRGPAAGTRRFIAQSYAGWPGDRTGPPVQSEQDPLDPSPPAGQRESLAAIRRLEQVVPAAAGLDGLVLRYGSLYGYGASDEFFGLARQRKVPVIGNGAAIWSFLHVADAATATAAAVEHGRPGLYNVVNDEPATVAEWLPFLAQALGAKPPYHIPAWLGRLAAGEVGISMMTQARGCANAKAKRELGWQLQWPSWRQGFTRGLAAPATSSAADA